jgi:predicted nuclease of predicted toxin-antitoxin system
VSSPSRPPDPFVFFVDRSLGKHVVADALREVGARVEIHDEWFPPDSSDEEWLAQAGRKGWIVLTKDNRLRYRPREKAVLLRSNVRAFILTARNLTGEEIAKAFTLALPRIENFLRRHAKACIVAVSRDGSLRPIVPPLPR